MTNPFLSIIHQTLPEPQAGLLAGMLFGVKSNLSRELYQALITTGTIHIVALSGQNIAILIRIISEVTLLFGRRISILLTIVSIAIFVWFVGVEASVVRAAIMGSLSLIAVYFGRVYFSLLSLIFTALIMILMHPLWIGDLSFQLSFLATLGIILFAKVNPFQPKSFAQEVKQDFIINLKITLAAQVFTVPLILIRLQQVSLISPLTNVLIAWAITPVMILGLIMCVLGIIFLPIGQVVAWLVWIPLTYIISVIKLTSKIPFANITW